MTPENSLPNFASDLVRIHKAISRGIQVSATRGAKFMREGFPDAGMEQGYARYVLSLTIVLGAHHVGEDEIAFPALRARLPAAPYGRLTADHQFVEAALGTVRNAIGDVAGDSARVGLSVVLEGLARVSSAWPRHMQLEEEHFAEKAIAAVMTPEEQAQVSVAMAKHSQARATPAYLALPFVLFNLAAEDRASMAETLPRVIVEQLVLKEWKDQWTPMKPFLLD
jgi:hypothetical protein